MIQPEKLQRRGLMFVLSSPSGAGKTTISRRLLERDAQLSISISVTTRKPRAGEVHGKDYFFVSEDQFARMSMENELLEHAKVFDYHYGTPKEFVEAQLAGGRDVLFDIDWQGTRQLAQNARGDLVSIFILPPSMEELERRLTTRAQDSAEVVQKRMSKAEAEISHWVEYDYVLVNRDVEETLGHVVSILQAERLRRQRQPQLAEFVKQLCG
ncbi:MAG: guanylate kinase [Alphaproteobacteria bacterium]|nr:guanylate kinase [Alphaproteobacteria bacterium]